MGPGKAECQTSKKTHFKRFIFWDGSRVQWEISCFNVWTDCIFPSLLEVRLQIGTWWRAEVGSHAGSRWKWWTLPHSQLQQNMWSLKNSGNKLNSTPTLNNGVTAFNYNKTRRSRFISLPFRRNQPEEKRDMDFLQSFMAPKMLGKSHSPLDLKTKRSPVKLEVSKYNSPSHADWSYHGSWLAIFLARHFWLEE